MTYGRGIDEDCPKISSEALSTNNPLTINFLVPYVYIFCDTGEVSFRMCGTHKFVGEFSNWNCKEDVASCKDPKHNSYPNLVQTNLDEQHTPVTQSNPYTSCDNHTTNITALLM